MEKKSLNTVYKGHDIGLHKIQIHLGKVAYAMRTY